MQKEERGVREAVPKNMSPRDRLPSVGNIPTSGNIKQAITSKMKMVSN